MLLYVVLIVYKDSVIFWNEFYLKGTRIKIVIYLNLRSQFSYVLILIFLRNKSGVESEFFSSFSPILIFLLGVHTRTHCFDYLIIPVKGVKSIRKKDDLFWSHLENRKKSSYLLALREEVWHPCFLSGQVWQLWQLDLSEIGRVKKR